jgi:hypothetical protein
MTKSWSYTDILTDDQKQRYMIVSIKTQLYAVSLANFVVTAWPNQWMKDMLLMSSL